MKSEARSAGRTSQSALERLDEHDLEKSLGTLTLMPHQFSGIIKLKGCFAYEIYIISSVNPRRITADTGITTDLFITSNPGKFSHSGVSQIGISDHSLICAISKLCILSRHSNINLGDDLKISSPY